MMISHVFLGLTTINSPEDRKRRKTPGYPIGNSRFRLVLWLKKHGNERLMRMNDLMQRIGHPFVKAFPGMSCGSGYFGMRIWGNAQG